MVLEDRHAGSIIISNIQMKILGNRVLVSKVEEPQGDGFKTVEVQDSFVNKGKIESIGEHIVDNMINKELVVKIGDTILFAKYSPDTQEIEHEGKKMKIVGVEDILAVL
jgi:co-chaperonin GroES (HSP10)